MQSDILLELFIMSPHARKFYCAHTHTLLMSSGFWPQHHICPQSATVCCQGINVPEEGDDSQSKGQKFTRRSGCSLLMNR